MPLYDKISAVEDYIIIHTQHNNLVKISSGDIHRGTY